MNDTVFLDDCLQNIFYAQEAMKEWIPITEYEILFESGISKDVKDKIAKNEDTANKSTGFLQKAINAVIRLISSITYPLRELIARFSLNGEEKKAFDRYKAAMERNPKLKNRRISVLDFKKTTKNYDGMLHEIDQRIKAVDADPNHSIEDIVHKATQFLGRTAGVATVIVGTELALKMANSNVEMAQNLSNLLNNESTIMKSISNSLGNRDATRFKKKIDVAAKNTQLHQLKVKIFRQKYDSLQDCVQSISNAFKGMDWGTALSMFSKGMKNKDTRKVIGTVVKGEAQLGARKVKKFFSRKDKDQEQTGVNAPLADFVTGNTKKK